MSCRLARDAETCDCCNEIIKGKRFCEMGIRAGLPTHFFHFRRPLGRHEEDGRFHSSLSESPADVESVIRSQKDIEDNDVVGAGFGEIQGLCFA